jgi:hypothetical protein
MAKIRTNFIELLLRQTLVGQQMYLDNGTLITIDEIDYQPIIKEVYIKSGADGYKLSIDVNYDFELIMDDRNKIIPNKGRIKGKNKEK